MCEYMQIHKVVEDHDNAFSFKDAVFFLDPAQRNLGRLDNDGRSCAVGQAQHGPFVSTTMQVQEGGDVTVKKEDK